MGITSGNIKHLPQYRISFNTKRKNAARRGMEMLKDELEVTMAVFDSTSLDHELEATEVGVFLDELSQTGKLEGVKYTLWDDRCTAKMGVECLVDPLPLDLPIAAARKLREKVFLKLILGYCADVDFHI
nr:putative pre-16S rRNA nuclease isoform X6 [Tanacetum cinerariifolium]